jgi:ribonuclease HI
MYAVANGRIKGVFTTWAECKDSVCGFKHAIYKKFETREQADAFVHAYVDVKTSSIDNCVEPDYYVYTDGACSKNGQPTAKAGIGIFFGVDDPRNVSKPMDGNQTNNAAELTAILHAYSIIEPDVAAGKTVVIVSDSEYAIKCLTTYGDKCASANWIATIPNRDLVRAVYETYKKTPSVRFMYVKAHTTSMDRHSIGNRYADLLATDSIRNLGI